MSKKGALCGGCPGTFKIATDGQPFHNRAGPIVGSVTPLTAEMLAVLARRSADRRRCFPLMPHS